MKKSKIEKKKFDTQPREYKVEFNKLSGGRVEIKAAPTPEEEKRNKKIGQLLTRKFLLLKKKNKLYNLAKGFFMGCFALAISTFVFIGGMLYKAYEFSKTDDFKTAQDTKISELTKDLENGKITNEQFKTAIDYVHGPNYMIDVMLESDSKEKKDYDKLNVAGTASSILSIASGVAALGTGLACKGCGKKAEKLDEEMKRV